MHCSSVAGNKWPIPAGKRLTAKIPFMLGGDFATNSLVAVDFLELIRFRTHIAGQIKELSDGAQIKIELNE